MKKFSLLALAALFAALCWAPPAANAQDGLVEVRANEGGAEQDVASGQLVRASAGAPRELVLASGSSGEVLADGSGLRGALGEAEAGAESSSEGRAQNNLSVEVPGGSRAGVT